METSASHLSHALILLIIGSAIFGGSIGARVFQKLRIPQVVGYIIIGLLVGRSGVGLIGEQEIESLLPFNFFAIGIIGFMIGGELHHHTLQKYGRQFVKILLAEGLTAFLTVTILTGLLAWLVSGNIFTGLALGLVLGAIASATAPAATVDVLWEYKTRGILTTTVLAIVAMDDALALLLYSLASSLALRLTGAAESSFIEGMLHTFYELGGALALGSAAGILLVYLIRFISERGKILTIILGILTLVLGLALYLRIDLILTAMALGMTLVNLAPQRSKEAFGLVEQFAAPIYTLFFVFVGARLTLGSMAVWMWALALAYVLGRTAGKILGSRWGAGWAKAPDTVRRYLGFCLFSQAGVAIGLSILASTRFQQEFTAGISIGTVIATVVTTTTFLVQIIGPSSVKYAMQKSGEIGRNITAEDLIRSYKVADVMNPDAPILKSDTTVGNLLRAVADTEAMVYPVVNLNNEIIGMIGIEDLKQLFGELGMGDWLLAYDLMQPVRERLTADMPLPEALRLMQELAVEALPVVEGRNGQQCTGLVELRAVNRIISKEILERRKRAEDSLL